MTVFLSHAPADRETAEGLEKALERRGLFVELDDGETALRPVQPSDAVVALISKDFVFSPWRLRHEQRALDAWSAGKLVLVKLDHHFAPVGLRDLPAIDACFEAQREFTWMKVADAVRERLKPARPAQGEAADARAAPQSKRGGGLLGALALLLLAAPGCYAAVVAVSIWLVNRIGARPGGWPELLSGIDGFGASLGLPAGLTPWLFAAAMAMTLCAFALLAVRLIGAARRPRAASTPAEAPAPAQSEAVFVSYARANEAIVLPVVDAARQAGHIFWVDQQGGVSAGGAWAGEIVRAMRGAASVVVMCSKAAFESDHVKREVYLADRYKKRLTPVFIEPAEPPEDFEYFFAGLAACKLFETPEAERPQAFVRVLG